mmetsp:Transcript_47228/g.140977  ORF Transcript_47228/g.140977 Transcript_47228/m.140977 type:complete len:202 (+) Transcript_47228:626-1231(+)
MRAVFPFLWASLMASRTSLIEICQTPSPVYFSSRAFFSSASFASSAALFSSNSLFVASAKSGHQLLNCSKLSSRFSKPPALVHSRLMMGAGSSPQSMHFLVFIMRTMSANCASLMTPSSFPSGSYFSNNSSASFSSLAFGSSSAGAGADAAFAFAFAAPREEDLALAAGEEPLALAPLLGARFGGMAPGPHPPGRGGGGAA